jgi:hypothetical protein
MRQGLLDELPYKLERMFPMSDQPDFSNDTGPGSPGVDNVHTPGKVYSSHHVDDSGCGLCRRRTGFWENDGSIVRGTEWQSTAYVWNLPAADIPARGSICDGCLEKYVERNELQMFIDQQGEKLKDLDRFAVATLFGVAARATLAEYEQLTSLPDGSVNDLIVPVTEDEIWRMMRFARSFGDLDDFVTSGNLYAAASLAFGKTLADPGFEAAAAYYAREWPFAGMTKEEKEKLADDVMEQLFLEAE